MAVKVNKKNIWILYGDDPVLIQEKKNELVRRYFKGNAPDPVVFDGTGNLEAYRASLEGQSLFSSETLVVIHNPFFLKKAVKKEEEKAYDSFLALLKEVGEDTFVVLTVDGKPDRRMKSVKSLLALASSIECTLLKARDGVEKMEEYLYDRKKKLAPDARAYLDTVLSAWTDISQPFLETECDKIILMCGEKDTVTKALLQEALPDYMDQGIFRFFDQLLDRQAEAVREGAARVFTDPQTTLKNIGFLAAQFRKIKMYKELTRAHIPQGEKLALLDIRGAWQLRSLESNARKVTEKEAETFLLALFQYQYTARLGGSEQEIEDLILQFCLHGKRRQTLDTRH